MVSTEMDVSDTFQLPNNHHISNGAIVETSFQEASEIKEQKDKKEKEKVSRNFTIAITKKLKFSIYKPLILLKLAMFIWYGASAAIFTFLLVFFKHRGLTLSELSIIYILTPLVQFFGPSLCGIIADKIGRSKPVLVGNLLLTIAITISMLLVPSMNIENCEQKLIELKCHEDDFNLLIEKTRCDVYSDVIKLVSCNTSCLENATQHCTEQNLTWEIIEQKQNFENFSLSVQMNQVYKLRNKCYYNITSVILRNVHYSWYNVSHKMYCKITCFLKPEKNCDTHDHSRTTYLVLNMILLMFFFAVLSNTYRFMDITAMHLVNEHECDYGRQRFFATVGVLIISPMFGYIVDATTTQGREKNYDVVFYLFIGSILLMLCVIYKLEVTIQQPGRNMWKKSLHLLKKIDNIVFLIVILVLGISWGFSRNLTPWYLEGMKAHGFLLGLISSVNALYGLPFLFCSNWWVKKIGTTQIFLLGLLGYSACGIGYSFLYDPWLALLIEATSIFTYHLLWVAVVVHSYSIAPEGLTATVISTVGGVHFSLGKGAGGFLGGQIMHKFGGRQAFRATAAMCAIFAVLFAIYLYMRKKFYHEAHNQQTNEGNMTIQ